MEKVMETLKKVFHRDNLDKIKNWCLTNKRYIFGVLLFVLLLLILRNCAAPDTKEDGQKNEAQEGSSENADSFVLDSAFEQDAHEDVNSLISSYFNAYSSGDLETIEKLARPLSDNEKSYIGVFSQYIEAYQNVSCYTKSGMNEGSYLVSAYFDMKFYGVQTAAPGLDFFYVETDENGELFINNLYSPYNLSRTENELDANVYAVILNFQQQEDSVALCQEVNAKYEEAVASDVDLATMIASTIPTAMSEWLDSVNALGNTESEESTEEEGTTENEPSTEEQPEDSPDENTDNNGEATNDAGTAEEEEPKNDTSVTTITVKVQTNGGNNVNIRSSASTNSDILGKAVDGDTFKKIGEEGEWTKIDYNGQEGYVKSSLLVEE